jgi:hypothetical protein
MTRIATKVDQSNKLFSSNGIVFYEIVYNPVKTLFKYNNLSSNE